MNGQHDAGSVRQRDAAAGGLPGTSPCITAGTPVPPVRVAVTSPDLKPGLLADVTLTFAKAGPVKLVAPVVSASEPEYESITVG